MHQELQGLCTSPSILGACVLLRYHFLLPIFFKWIPLLDSPSAYTLQLLANCP